VGAERPPNRCRRGAKFNLTVVQQAYFDRLRARVQQLQQNGILRHPCSCSTVSILTYLTLWQYGLLGDGYPFTGVTCQGIDDGYSGERSGTASMT